MHSIWAVATNTIKQALRMKIAVVFIILLVVLLPVMGYSMTGDGTLKGRLQTFVSYGLSLTSFLLCLFTIIVSIYSLTSDIKQKQIYTVVTKPIRRFELLLGKLLGIILLDAALLALFSAIIYAIATCIPILVTPIRVVLLGIASLVCVWAIIYTVTTDIRIRWKVFGLICQITLLVILVLFTIYTVAAYKPEFSEAQFAEVRNEFFTARAGLTVPEADVRQEVLETYNKLVRNGQLDQALRDVSHKKIIADLTKRKQLEKRAAGVGQDLLWEFNNVKIFDDPNQSFFIRYKYDVSVNPPDLQLYGRWVVGDLRQIRYGTKIQTPVYSVIRRELIRTFHELEVPGDAVAEDGYLGVRFINLPANSTVVIFPLKAGLEVLYKADTFGANFIRAVLLILFRLIFLACLGILAATFLSFPVAILLCLVIFFTATVSVFVIDSFYYISEGISGVYSIVIKPIIQLLPQFDKFNPTKFLVPGRLLSWPLLAKAAGLMVCVKAVLLLLLATLIFSYKEIARIIV